MIFAVNYATTVHTQDLLTSLDGHTSSMPSQLTAFTCRCNAWAKLTVNRSLQLHADYIIYWCQWLITKVIFRMKKAAMMQQ